MERLLKLGHVRDYAVDAVFFRGMRVYGGAQTLGLIPGLATPALAVADKEALLGREAIDRIQRLAFGVILPRRERQNQSAQIGDIFSQCQLAIDLDVVDDRVSRILI